MATHSRKKPSDPNLALRIEVEMLRRNWTKAALAAAGGKTRSAASHWISGRYEPSNATLRRLAEAFGVSIERLTGKGLTKQQLETERRYLELVRDLRSPALLDLIGKLGAERALEILAFATREKPGPKKT